MRVCIPVAAVGEAPDGGGFGSEGGGGELPSHIQAFINTIISRIIKRVYKKGGAFYFKLYKNVSDFIRSRDVCGRLLDLLLKMNA
jgi:hypothetical protein